MSNAKLSGVCVLLGVLAAEFCGLLTRTTNVLLTVMGQVERSVLRVPLNNVEANFSIIFWFLYVCDRVSCN